MNERHSFESLTIVFFLCLSCYIMLATGTILPFEINGVWVPFLSVYYLIVLAIILSKGRYAQAAIYLIILLSPFTIWLIISAMRTNDLFYSLEKIDGAVLVSVFSSIIGCYVVGVYGRFTFLQVFVYCAALVLAITVVYKVNYGLFVRDVRFFINGPIIFGWIMGFSCIVSIYLAMSKVNVRLNFFISVVFLLATIWTYSKGPLVALLISVFILQLRRFRTIGLCFSVVLGAFGLYLLGQFPDVFGRLAVIEQLATGQVSLNELTSIKARIDMVDVSWSMIKENPLFGIGLANWSDGTNLVHIYPHNIYLEILSETGGIGFFVFLATFGFLYLKTTFLGRLFMTYFLVCSGFSGDITYLHFAVFFGFVLFRKQWGYNSSLLGIKRCYT